MAKISKIWNKAGSLPGQYQKLTLQYVDREKDNVKVHWTLYVSSLGYDYYNYDTRHNKFNIYCLGKVQASGTYQLYGQGASKTFSGDFTVNGVSGSDDDLTFQYENIRVWNKKTNSYDPRSTGVVNKTSVGTLTIPKAKFHDVDFDLVVSPNIYHYGCYHDDTFTIPKLSPTTHYFNFIGWTLENYMEGKKKDRLIDALKSAKVQYTSGKKIKVSKNIDFYAVWRPKSCTYKFYGYDGKLIDSVQHEFGSQTKLPNLDSDTYKNGKYKVAGYTFRGWQCRRTNGVKKFYSVDSLEFKTCDEFTLTTSNSGIVSFYAKNNADENTVVFHFPNNTLYNFDYETNDKFNMEVGLDKYCTDNRLPANTIEEKSIKINVGYKLVGWSTIFMKEPAKPNEAYKKFAAKDNYYVGNRNKTETYRVYPISGDVVLEYQDFDKKTLHLYPYYEYYTTIYVYVQNEWKLAMPYVYTQDGWKPSLPYCYTQDGWKI